MISKDKQNRLIARCHDGHYMEMNTFKSQQEYLKYVSQLCERYNRRDSDITGFRIYISNHLLLEVGMYQ